MKRNVFADQQVMTSVNSGFAPVEIDMNSAEDAAVLARYNVVGPPVTIITDHHRSPPITTGMFSDGAQEALLNPSSSNS